ncbi:MAG TPA: hemerythrin family protein [Negativicutes bacterium]|nr:hemerythrin family protein [Negativicutes bacterium]
MTTYRFGGERLTGIAALLGLRAGLVSLANLFYREARDCSTFYEEDELTSRFLSQFMEGSAACFACEEELMSETFYRDSEDHKDEHGDFTARLYALRRRHKLGEPAMAIEIFQEVREWFLTHWEDADGRLFPYLDRVVMLGAVSTGGPTAVGDDRGRYGSAEVTAAH